MRFNLLSEKNIKKIFSFTLVIFFISLMNLSIMSDIRLLIKNIVTSEPSKEAVMQHDNVVSVFLGYNFSMEKNRPIISIPFKNYVLTDGIFYFEQCEDLRLKNGAEGIIKNIGYKGEEKYIEILHNGNIKSVYLNVDVIGVNTNLKVNKGELISTIKANEIFKFYVTYNDDIVTDFVIKDGEIIWQN